MNINHIIAVVTVAGACACSSAMAWDQDPFAQYIQRSDTVTLGAGNAKEVNSAIHTIDPWPPYVGDRFIPIVAKNEQGAIVGILTLVENYAIYANGNYGIINEM